MSENDKHLRKIGFSKYEAEMILTLVKYKELQAREIAKYAEIPQPKVYETATKLENRGLLEEIRFGKKRYYRIKSRKTVEEKIKEMAEEYRYSSSMVLETVNKTYNTIKHSGIPFIGLGDEQTIAYHMNDLLDEAKESFFANMPSSYYNKSFIKQLEKTAGMIKITLIFNEQKTLEKVRLKCPDAEFYYLETSTYEFFEKIILNGLDTLTPEQANNFLPKRILENMNSFNSRSGAVLIDDYKSLMLFPFPIPIPIAFLSISPEFIIYVREMLEDIVNNARKY